MTIQIHICITLTVLLSTWNDRDSFTSWALNTTLDIKFCLFVSFSIRPIYPFYWKITIKYKMATGIIVWDKSSCQVMAFIWPRKRSKIGLFCLNPFNWRWIPVLPNFLNLTVHEFSFFWAHGQEKKKHDNLTPRFCLVSLGNIKHKCKITILLYTTSKGQRLDMKTCWQITKKINIHHFDYK